MFILIFIASVLLSSVSQVILKTSANKEHSGFIKEYLNVRVILAYTLFFASTIITVFAYKYVPLSLGPVLESSGYVFVAVLSYFILNERLTKRQIIGMVLIVVGVLAVAFGGYV